MPVKDVFDLFDTLVKPIILFNSEIWGINIKQRTRTVSFVFYEKNFRS